MHQAVGDEAGATDLAAAELPPSGEVALAVEDEDEPVADTHSRPVAAADLQPSPIAEPTIPEGPATAVSGPVAAAPAAPGGHGAKPPSQTAQAVVETAKHATQSAKQATQQVTAAVQQQAQRITVAPRKAIYRGKRFMLVYGVAVGAATLLAIFARRHRYFPADVGITRLLQQPSSRLYDRLMHTVSELGWRWTSVATRAATSFLMWIAGFRMEGAFTLASWSGDVVSALIKVSVVRPRPTKDLVRVASELKEFSFPSGHVVHYVTFYGFLFYLVYTQLKEGWLRSLLLTILGSIVMLVGPSRIYMGHHWPSDVGGAYLVGTLWLGVQIIMYLETKANYTVHTHPPFLVKRPQQLG